jgi:2-hydroxychromene-2-carboxylate isomerase
MAEPRTVTAYIDYKSPYAFLAKDPAYELERDFSVRIDWLPYVLDIPSFLGSARVDDTGNVIEEQRNAHQWRRVRYSYMDCRRQARKRAGSIAVPVMRALRGVQEARARLKTLAVHPLAGSAVPQAAGDRIHGYSSG